MNPVFETLPKTLVERHVDLLADVVAHNSRFLRGREPSYFTYAGHNPHFTHTILHFASCTDPLHAEIARQTLESARKDMNLYMPQGHGHGHGHGHEPVPSTCS